jgi:acetylornithine deacetylase
LLLAELDALDTDELPRRATHPLLGRASLHASLITGGTGLSTYPDRCVLRLERRTLPGERTESVLAELRAACERVRTRRPEFDADVALDFAQPPSEVAADAPLVRALVAALGAAGEASSALEGMSAWTDAALLNAAGIPAVCFGPGDVALAHAATEYVPLDEIERAARVLVELIGAWSD